MPKNDLLEQNRELLNKNRQLEEENRQLKRRIDGFVYEFRVCRMCKNLHKDCTPSPTDSSCVPKWGGL